MRLKPEWLKGHYRKGEALLHLQRFPQAVAAFEVALELDPSNEEVLAKLALARTQLSEKHAEQVVTPSEVVASHAATSEAARNEVTSEDEPQPQRPQPQQPQQQQTQQVAAVGKTAKQLANAAFR